MADTSSILSAIVSSVISAVSETPSATPPVVTPLVRNFPLGTLTGTLVPPLQDGVLISNKLYGRSAALQIRGTQNLLVLPASLQSEVPVRYQLDMMGNVWRIWILSAAETAAPDFKK